MTNEELDALQERLARECISAPGINGERRMIPLNPDGPDALAAIKALREERDEAVAKLGTDVWGLRTMWRDAVNRAEAAEASAEKAESVLSAIEKWFSTTGHSCSSTTSTHARANRMEAERDEAVEALKDIEMETRDGSQWTLREVNEVTRSVLSRLKELKDG
jgi:hypothetical protein